MSKNNTAELPAYQMPFIESSSPQEEALLGLLLNKRNLAYQVATRIRPEHFGRADYRSVATALLELAAEAKEVHSITVMQRLMKNEGITLSLARKLVTELTDKLGGRDTHIVGDLVRDVVENWQRRELARLSMRMLSAAGDQTKSVGTLLADGRSSTDSIINGGATELTTKEHVEGFLEQTQKMSEMDEALLGPKIFGIDRLDRALDGAAPGGLVIFAGWTGSGKTVIFNTVMHQATKLNIPVAMWSGEQSEGKQIGALIGASTKTNKRAIEKGAYLTEEKLVSQGLPAKVKQAAQKIVETGHVFLTGEMDEARLFSTITFQHYVNGINVFLFDRKELFSVQGMQDDDKAIGMLLSKLRTLATNLGVWIGVASQVTKGHLRNPGSMAGLGDVLGSVAATSAATAVVIVHRYEVYGIYADANGNSLKDAVLLRVVKNSYGICTDVRACFKSTYGLFIEDDALDSTLPPTTRGKKKQPQQTVAIDDNPTQLTEDEDLPF